MRLRISQYHAGWPKNATGCPALQTDTFDMVAVELVVKVPTNAKGLRFEEAQRELEKRFIAQVLTQADGTVCKAADLLGMHRNTLSRKIVAYRLRRA